MGERSPGTREPPRVQVWCLLHPPTCSGAALRVGSGPGAPEAPVAGRPRGPVPCCTCPGSPTQDRLPSLPLCRGRQLGRRRPSGSAHPQHVTQDGRLLCPCCSGPRLEASGAAGRGLGAPPHISRVPAKHHITWLRLTLVPVSACQETLWPQPCGEVKGCFPERHQDPRPRLGQTRRPATAPVMSHRRTRSTRASYKSQSLLLPRGRRFQEVRIVPCLQPSRD